MDLSKFEVGIRKTGFLLEFKVSAALRAEGWTVIGNKYYLDDHSEVPREIDLVAYRAEKLPSFTLYTTLVVSCKKNEEKAWALLTKRSDPRDPNMDWRPVHAFSNHRPLKFMLEEPGWRESYLESMGQLDCGELFAIPERQIFAFQEMDLTSGSPKNDSNIFGSITSLMKAQAYELGVLPDRKALPVVYQFNLLAVVEAPLIRLDLESDEVIRSCETSDEAYVASYIINRRPTIARIHFVQAESLESALERYTRLHLANYVHFYSLQDRFYGDAHKNWRKLQVFQQDLARRLRWLVVAPLRGEVDADKLRMTPGWSEQEKCLVVHVSELNEHQVAELNADHHLRARLSKALLDLYRYQGASRFGDDDIPF